MYFDTVRAIARKFAQENGHVLPNPKLASVRFDAAHGLAVAEWYWGLESADSLPDSRVSFDRSFDLWVELGGVIDQQYAHILKAGITHRVVDHDPIADIRELRASLERGHLDTFRTEPNSHPIWSDSQNDRFRFVHDVLGHFAHGLDFSREGEDMAYRAHRATMPRHLWPALATETRGQNAALNFGVALGLVPEPTFAPQHAVPAPGWVYVP